MLKILIISLFLLYIFKDKLELVKNIEPTYFLIIGFLLYFFRKKMIEGFMSSPVRINKIILYPCAQTNCKEDIFNKLKQNYNNIVYIKSPNSVRGGSFDFNINLDTQGIITIEYNDDQTYNKIVEFLKNHSVDKKKKITIKLSKKYQNTLSNDLTKLNNKLISENMQLNIETISDYQSSISLTIELVNNNKLYYSTTDTKKFSNDVDKIISIITDFKSSI